MTQSKDDDYIPRSNLGFPDRRRTSRFRLTFADEAEIEGWEQSDRRVMLADVHDSK